MSNEKSPHLEFADSLRALAAFVDDLPPELAIHFEYMSETVNVSVVGADDPAAVMAAFSRAGLAHHAKVTKDFTEKFGAVKLHFGRAQLDVFAAREQVCERVQVGEETVTKTVPDPTVEVPMVEVSETVPKYEWQCRPLLVAEKATGGAA